MNSKVSFFVLNIYIKKVSRYLLLEKVSYKKYLCGKKVPK
jgi:hypothetical protein